MTPVIMKLFLLLAVFVGCAAAQAAKVENPLTMQEFIQDWKISKLFTMQVADAMPAEFYNFKPTPEEMTFGELIAHIGAANVFRFSEISGKPAPFVITDPRKLPSDKAGAMKLLEQSFDYVIEVLPQITEEQLSAFHVGWKNRPGDIIDGRGMIMNIFVHVAHHRAQCEVYLRLKGITPPTYTF
jgi:uncharacterized damage-inducible protein DinB